MPNSGGALTIEDLQGDSIEMEAPLLSLALDFGVKY